MHCDRMHAIIRVTECLEKQSAKHRFGDNVYIGCKKCPTGKRARAGELNDDDVEARLSALRAERGTEKWTAREENNMRTRIAKRQEVEMEADMKAPEPDPTKKQCGKCGEWKDRSEFYKEGKSKDGLQRYCRGCKNFMYRKWRDRGRTGRSEASPPEPAQAASAPVILDARTPAVGITEVRCVPGEIVADGYPDHILVLDFSEHVEALEKLRELAKAELRTPGAQLLYWFLRGKIAG
jgi:hypothetical protein